MTGTSPSPLGRQEEVILERPLGRTAIEKEDDAPQLRALRYSFECARLGLDCARSFAGSKDAVLTAAAMHHRRDHGDGRGEAALRAALEPSVRLEAFEWFWSGIDGSGPLSGPRADRPA
jgi:predicted small metal-binding protein